MQFQVITLFAEMFSAITDYGVVGRAFAQGKVQLDCINPRDFTDDAYQTVDGRPYGGGPGMVMLPEPLWQAIAAAKHKTPQAPVVYLSPQGEPLTQSLLTELAELPELILLSGRYEGVDQRLINKAVDREISLGDYVLSGGELPAMVLIDGLTRLLPGVLGHKLSAVQDSFTDNLLDCPHYTRPEVWQNEAVPEVLLSGHHAKIAAWRQMQSEQITQQKRSDLKNREKGYTSAKK